MDSPPHGPSPRSESGFSVFSWSPWELHHPPPTKSPVTKEKPKIYQDHSPDTPWNTWDCHRTADQARGGAKDSHCISSSPDTPGFSAQAEPHPGAVEPQCSWFHPEVLGVYDTKSGPGACGFYDTRTGVLGWIQAVPLDSSRRV